MLGTLPPPTSIAHAPTFQGQPPAVGGSLPGLTLQPPAGTGSEVFPAMPRLVVPQKVSERILKGQFVDMVELLPDSWRYEESQHPGSGMRSPPRRPPITDIAIWVECYTLMAGVICSRYPEKAIQLFQYLRTIVRASRNFEGSSWVSYDSAFRRLAANSCSFDWGVIEPSLYNEAFTGRARIKTRCAHCLEDSHQTKSCPLLPSEDWPRPSRRDAPPASGVPLCGLFNSLKGNSCRFQDCRFAHICSLCRKGGHPASACQQRRRQGATQSPQAPSS